MTILDPHRDFLEYALSIGALKFSQDKQFVSENGRMSPYSFNSALFTSGNSIQTLMLACGRCWYNDIEESSKADVIFGLADKGIPLSYALTLTLGLEEIEYAFNDNSGRVIGADLKGKRVLIIYEIITSVKETREAIKIITQQGGIVVGCLVCFDPQEKSENTELSPAQQVEKKFRIPVYSAVSFADLFPFIQMEGSEYQDMLPLLEAYREKYGINVEGNK